MVLSATTILPQEYISARVQKYWGLMTRHTGTVPASRNLAGPIALTVKTDYERGPRASRALVRRSSDRDGRIRDNTVSTRDRKPSSGGSSARSPVHGRRDASGPHTTQTPTTVRPVNARCRLCGRLEPPRSSLGSVAPNRTAAARRPIPDRDAIATSVMGSDDPPGSGTHVPRSFRRAPDRPLHRRCRTESGRSAWSSIVVTGDRRAPADGDGISTR